MLERGGSKTCKINKNVGSEKGIRLVKGYNNVWIRVKTENSVSERCKKRSEKSSTGLLIGDFLTWLTKVTIIKCKASKTFRTFTIIAKVQTLPCQRKWWKIYPGKIFLLKKINHCPKYRCCLDGLLVQSVLKLTNAFHETYSHLWVYSLFNNFLYSSFNSF